LPKTNAELAGALEREGSPQVGADCGTLAGLEANGIAVADTMDAAFANADAILDFTAPAATVAVAEHAAQAASPM
jgi:4-hydroxy-tetrahydrodipicolinate reductase